MSVIVTNARSRIAYNVARSLSQKDIRVCAADFVPRSMSFVSRYVDSHFVYPSPFREPEGFLCSVLAEIERSKAEVLIPAFEETFLIAKHKDRFSTCVALALPDYSQILVAHNKNVWEPIARGLGIPVPASYSIDTLRCGKAPHVRYPLFVKPKQGGGAWGIHEEGSPKELEKLLSQATCDGKPWDRFFAQEKIVGETHCVAMLFREGRVRAKVGYKQLRDYPATGGQATLRVSARHEAAESYLEQLLEHLNWHGPCQADFIIDAKCGTPHLIDINPRLWGSLTQAIASGVDFPYLIYRLAKDGDVSPVPSFKTGVVTRWIGGDLAALPARLKSSDARFQVLRDFCFPSEPTALFDDFSMTDPLPLLEWGLDTFLRAMRFRTVKPASHDSLEGIWE